PLRFGGANLAIAIRLGDFDPRFVDRLRGRFLTEGIDVTRHVGNVLDVYVDQAQPDFLQLDFDSARDVGDELVAIGVDLLDVHRRDDDTHLSEDDVLREFLYLRGLKTEHALGRILHHARLRRDAYCEGRRRIDADVLFRKRALEIDLDRHRREIEELIVLDDGPDEGGAAV